MYARNGKSRTGHTCLQQQLTNTHKLNFLLVCPETEWRRKEAKNKKGYCKKFLFYMQTKQLLINLQAYNENF